MQIINIDSKNTPAETENVYFATIPTPNYYNAIPVKIGLKIECNKEALDSILLEQYTKENFTLNIKKVSKNLFRNTMVLKILKEHLYEKRFRNIFGITRFNGRICSW